MKHKFCKAILFCTALAMLTALGSGCTKSEPTQTTAAFSAESTPEQKAMLLYAQLLEANPAIVDRDAECLNDLSFGYEDNLAKFGMHYDSFAVLDLDNDGIPELIAATIVNRGWVPISVFRYDAGENALQLLKDPLDPESHATFEHMSTAGGRYTLYLCKENHLHSNWAGDTPIGFQEENHAYALTQAGLSAADCAISCHSEDTSGIAVLFDDILTGNDAETRNSIFGAYL